MPSAYPGKDKDKKEAEEPPDLLRAHNQKCHADRGLCTSAPRRSSSLQLKRLAAGLIVSLLVVFWVPMLLWGDIDFGMKMVTFAEPLTEFVLIPLCAASLTCLMIQHIWRLLRA